MVNLRLTTYIIDSMNFKVILLLFLSSALFAQSPVFSDERPSEGPAAADYKHQSIDIVDRYDKQSGYYIFIPSLPKKDTADLVVFNHGYGAINPMIFGKWITHLVRKGNIVIYPRYQKNLISPSPSRFTSNAAKGIRSALSYLAKNNIEVDLSTYYITGHSYGGVITANIAADYQRYKLPKPKGVFLCEPGTGPFTEGVKESYIGIANDIDLLIMVGTNDQTVGQTFGRKVFEEATDNEQRTLLVQDGDYSGRRPVTASHYEPYSLDLTFDNGNRNFTAKRALRVSKLDVVDYYGYWKLFDAMMACGRADKHCDEYKGSSSRVTYLGTWADGKAVKPLEMLQAKSTQIVRQIEE